MSKGKKNKTKNELKVSVGKGQTLSLVSDFHQEKGPVLKPVNDGDTVPMGCILLEERVSSEVKATEKPFRLLGVKPSSEDATVADFVILTEDADSERDLYSLMESFHSEQTHQVPDSPEPAPENLASDADKKSESGPGQDVESERKDIGLGLDLDLDSEGRVCLKLRVGSDIASVVLTGHAAKNRNERKVLDEWVGRAKKLLSRSEPLKIDLS